jgi:tetratricopeptide (TPR) repeat protein
MTSTASLLRKLALACACGLLFQSVPAEAAPRSTKPAARKGKAAEPNDPKAVKAKALFLSGLDKYDKGEYALALKDFLAAQELTPRKSIQLNIARTHRALGDADSARQAYMALIRDYADGLLSGQELTGQEREEAEQEVTNACRKLVDAAEYARALTALSAAREILKGKAARPIAVLLGRTYEAREDDGAAYRVYSDLLDQDGELADAKLRMTDKERGDTTLALERVRRRTAAVRGRVRPSGARIRMIDPPVGPGYEDTIDPETFERGLREKVGKHTYEFSKAGYVTETRVVDLTPDSSMRLDVTLRPKPIDAFAFPPSDGRAAPAPTPPPFPAQPTWAAPAPSPPPSPPPPPAYVRPAYRPPPPFVAESNDSTITGFFVGGGLWLPLAKTRTLTYGDQRPAGMSEGADSPFRLSFTGTPKGVATGLLLWAHPRHFTLGLNLMLQYRRFSTDFSTVGGTRLGGFTFDEFLGCLCVGGGYAHSGPQFFLGPLLGGAVSHIELDPHAPSNFGFERGHYIDLGFHLEVRYIMLRYIYLAGGLQYAFSLSSIALRQGNTPYSISFPETGMQGVWFGLGLQL